jgi:hypothetical protein
MDGLDHRGGITWGPGYRMMVPWLHGSCKGGDLTCLLVSCFIDSGHPRGQVWHTLKRMQGGKHPAKPKHNIPDRQAWTNTSGLHRHPLPCTTGSPEGQGWRAAAHRVNQDSHG